MPEPPFHLTHMGETYYKGTLPALIAAMTGLTATLQALIVATAELTATLEKRPHE